MALGSQGGLVFAQGSDPFLVVLVAGIEIRQLGIHLTDQFPAFVLDIVAQAFELELECLLVGFGFQRGLALLVLFNMICNVA